MTTIPPPPPRDRCYALPGGGHVLASEPPSPDLVRALDAVRAAVQAEWDAKPAEERAELERRQQLHAERNRARLARIRGDQP